MIDLYLALYAEGDTDDRFLKSVIERTAEHIVHANRGEPVEVRSVFVVDRNLLDAADGAGKVLQAARDACEYDILIIHKDGDTQTHKEVLETRFTPGCELIRQCPVSEKVCRNLVPIVPVKMMEAWMLADLQAVLNALNAAISPKDLRVELKKVGLTLPSKPHQVTSIRDPKQMLDQIVRIAHTQRDMTRNRLYEPLGSEIDLQVLERLDSYNQFVEDLRATIAAVGKIQI